MVVLVELLNFAKGMKHCKGSKGCCTDLRCHTLWKCAGPCYLAHSYLSNPLQSEIEPHAYSDNALHRNPYKN